MNGATRTSSRPPTDRAGLAAPATTILLALTLPLWLESPYFLHVVIMAGIFGVLALSLNLLLGYTRSGWRSPARSPWPRWPAG